MSKKEPTPRGRVILERLEEQSLSIRGLEQRSKLAKNTILSVIYGDRTPQRKTIEILAETLDLPVETLVRPDAEIEPRDADSFFHWLLRRDNAKLWVCIVGIAAAGWTLFGGSSVPGAIHAVQGLVIFVLLAMLPRAGTELMHSDASLSLRLAGEARRDLRRKWGAVWLCWLILYVVLTGVTLLGGFPDASSSESVDHWVLLMLNLIQNSATVWLFLCYEIVALPTIEDDQSRRRNVPNEVWIGGIVVVTLMELFVVLRPEAWPMQVWFGWAGGFAQGTALALLVGRFDSKYVDPPSFVVALLYFYAVIQGAWQAFQGEPQLMLWLTFSALALKCLLFLFVAWLFESDVVLFYLAGMRKLDRAVRHDRARFLTRYRAGDTGSLGDDAAS